MIGHQSITELRMHGYVPEYVHVYVSRFDLDHRELTHPELNIENGFAAEIYVTPRDRSVLDFRCVVGLVVLLQGDMTPESDARVMQVMRQIERAEPKRIVATLSDRIIDTAQVEVQSA